MASNGGMAALLVLSPSLRLYKVLLNKNEFSKVRMIEYHYSYRINIITKLLLAINLIINSSEDNRDTETNMKK